MVDALVDFGFGENDVSADLFTRKDTLVIIGVEPMAIDILNYLAGVNFEQAYQRRNSVAVEDVEISLVAYEDLFKNKKSVGRLKDLADVEELEKRNR